MLLQNILAPAINSTSTFSPPKLDLLMGTAIPWISIITLILAIINPPIIIPFLLMKPMLLFLPPSQMMSIMTNSLLWSNNNFIPTQYPDTRDLYLWWEPEAPDFNNALSTDRREFVFGLSIFQDFAPLTRH